MSAITRILAAGLVSAVAVARPPRRSPSAADVRVAGTCSKSSSAKLKLGSEDSRIETEFEVRPEPRGVRWKVTLRRNGALAVSTRGDDEGPQRLVHRPPPPDQRRGRRRHHRKGRQPVRRDLHRARHAALIARRPDQLPA